MFRLLLLGIVMVLFMDEGDRVLTQKWVRYCNECKHFDGYKCVGGMKKCWKFDIYRHNRSCSTENFYASDRLTGRYLFRYTKLSCKPCEEGMFQLFHDLLRETFCCTDKNRCNNGYNNLDITRLHGLEHEDELMSAGSEKDED
ncbi:prostate and testis expressed protein 13-like [Nycticebus coucang]|uniref:prostate and testis expressed protein 13-like n=1 Tax=Nycticebus coucang TaxID=9470 RepID=UPI00234C3D60|nr:prostate and testis expressed protein 13-like [Nycticebus coucang]